MVGITLPKRLEQRSSRQDFSHRHGVNPDRPRVADVERVREPAKTVGEAADGFPAPQALEDDHRHYGQEVEKQGGTIKEVHQANCAGVYVAV